MYYELYIDVLFLENFMMDSLLLLAVNRVMRCSRSYGRIFLGGALGSVLTCLVIAVPFPAVLKLVFFHIVINSLMITAGLRIRSAVQFIKAFLLLYFTAFVSGGILQALRPYLRYAGLFYASAVACFFIFSKLWKTVSVMFRKDRDIMEVAVYTEQGKYLMRALLDTGNVLSDPVTGAPVSILDPDSAGKMFGSEDQMPGFRYIPYRCVGGESIMKVFRAEKMCVRGEEELWVKSPLLGIGESSLCEDGSYQMILNPDIFVR